MAIEKFGNAKTVQDLLDFILTVPPALLQLPITVFDKEDRDHEDGITLEAFSVHETEGCLEQGFYIRLQDGE